MLNERHEAFAAYTMPQPLTLVKRFAEIQLTNVNLCSRAATCLSRSLENLCEIHI